jgi:hypothetical protein
MVFVLVLAILTFKISQSSFKTGFPEPQKQIRDGPGDFCTQERVLYFISYFIVPIVVLIVGSYFYLTNLTHQYLVILPILGILLVLCGFYYLLDLSGRKKNIKIPPIITPTPKSTSPPAPRTLFMLNAPTKANTNPINATKAPYILINPPKEAIQSNSKNPILSIVNPSNLPRPTETKQARRPSKTPSASLGSAHSQNNQIHPPKAKQGSRAGCPFRASKKSCHFCGQMVSDRQEALKTFKSSQNYIEGSLAFRCKSWL